MKLSNYSVLQLQTQVWNAIMNLKKPGQSNIRHNYKLSQEGDGP